MSNKDIIPAKRRKGTRARAFLFFKTGSSARWMLITLAFTFALSTAFETRAESTDYHLAYAMREGRMTTKRLVVRNLPYHPTSALVELAAQFESDPALGSTLEKELKKTALEKGVTLTTDLNDEAPITLRLILLKNADETIAEFRWSGGAATDIQPRISGSCLIPRDSDATTAAKQLAIAIAEDLSLSLLAP